MTVRPSALPIHAGIAWSGCGAWALVSRRRALPDGVIAAGRLLQRGAFCTTAPGECLNRGLSRQEAPVQLRSNCGSMLLPVAGRRHP